MMDFPASHVCWHVFAVCFNMRNWGTKCLLLCLKHVIVSCYFPAPCGFQGTHLRLRCPLLLPFSRCHISLVSSLVLPFWKSKFISNFHVRSGWRSVHAVFVYTQGTSTVTPNKFGKVNIQYPFKFSLRNAAEWLTFLVHIEPSRTARTSLVAVRCPNRLWQ